MDIAVKKERPKILKGPTEEVTTGCGHLYVRLGYDEGGNLLEVIATLGKAGCCAYCQIEAMSRSISLGLKYGVPVQEYVKQLIDLKCPSKVMWPEAKRVLSCADGMAKVLERYQNGYQDREGTLISSQLAS